MNRLSRSKTSDLLTLDSCPVCKNHIGVRFFEPAPQPLATLGWPKTANEAKAMTRLSLDFKQCLSCAHVWNTSFSYDAIPYQINPSRMYNDGSIWQGHMVDTRALLLERVKDAPTVIEVGCGEGHFLRALADLFGEDGRFIGFDPDGSGESGQGIEFFSRVFDPVLDVERFKPDLILMRHVLEHLTRPLEFIQKLAWASGGIEKPLWFFAEVPCIDKVFETGRLSDFFYEHPSHFSSHSFRTLLENVGDVVDFQTGYSGEVIYALARVLPQDYRIQQVSRRNSFFEKSKESISFIQVQLRNLALSGKKTVIWGGTGKAAAFINLFSANSGDFPWVVDSDSTKVGYYVPGTGQLIRSPLEIKSDYIDVVIIPSQWRARDISKQIDDMQFSIGQILIEHQGKLIDFQKEEHPY
tara:strand:- start:65 stop:1297 length:1233 start_codon:yes stop_codon:yes gene_type:complete